MARKRKVRITNPFEDFISSANFLTDLTRKSRSVSKSEREDFLHNQTRLDFLCNLVSRLGILAYCYDSILKLTDQLRAWDLKVNALPPDPEDPDVTDMPEELAEEEEHCLVEIDAFISLIYYEVTSIVSMLRQLRIPFDTASEVVFLVKVRDRFLSHVHLSGVRPGRYRGYSYSVPEHGPLDLDMIAITPWSFEPFKPLRKRALKVGSPAWIEQRERNEQLILSRKRNEDFTPEDIANLMEVGVRECNLELALSQLHGILYLYVLPIIKKETDEAINRFGYERIISEIPSPEGSYNPEEAREMVKRLDIYSDVKLIQP